MVTAIITLDSIQDHLLHGWIAEVLIVLLTVLSNFGFRGVLKSFGKYEILRNKTVVHLVLTLIVLFVLVVVQHIIGTLDEINASSPRRGGFRAGLISLMALSGAKTGGPPTNQFSMSGIGVPASASKLESGVTFGMIVRIENSGQPSVAWNWKVRLLLPGGSQLPALIPSVSVMATEPAQTLIGPYYFKMEDNLIQSMSVNPLATGAGKIGWLMLHISEVTEVPYGSRFILTFDDVFGRETKIEHVWDLGPK